MDSLMFYVAAAWVVGMAAAVLLARSPLRSALALIAALCGVAALYVQLQAGFVAAMQVLVYAGAIMVLFLFVIMLLNLGLGGDLGRPIYWAVSRVAAMVATIWLSWRLMAAALGPLAATGTGSPPLDGSVRQVGEILVTRALFPFEAISILLLVAVVGAVVLAGQRDGERQVP